MVETLEEIMGEEYAESFPGQMYKAFEKIKPECSNFKFKSLAKEISNLIPAHTRERLGFQTVVFNGVPVTRQEKERAWEELPELNNATVQKITAHIIWAAPKTGKDLIKLWQSDPRQFAWQIINVFKLLSSIYGFSGGWC